ncbi:TBCC domain-containing protein 1-like [Salvia splendens]|uniref:TBCC domain-containing protein 1-like n=1 Tax=Salvia splendens TaxID=180675 RepID=UPI001C272DD4|nr:TBCC domain-containing protein 1-like [Salvia splendens]
MDSDAAGQQHSHPPKLYLHPRREPFEHGLLPIPQLIFTDCLQSLSLIKSNILSSTPNHRVNSETLARVLQIPPDHSRLLIETISVVLHDDSDPLLKATTPQEIDEAGVNVFDLLLFLYLQNYKRLLPKGHKDSAAVADVWPSTSAFDGFLSVLSPLQLVRSNSRRFVPSQGDEEAHQLSYLHKHIGNILCLLADSVDGKGNKEGEAEGEEGYESMMLSVDKFEHLGFLLYFGDKGSQRFPLSQNTPFFANSDPNMPASPVPAPHVLDWLLENISSAQEYISERMSTKENGPSSSSDQDVAMADAAASSAKPSSSVRGPSLVEGVSKSSCVKQTSDIKGTSVKVVNCHESVIYILAPVKYATVYGCSDATIVLGAVGKAVRVEHCERVHLISTTKRICIANCRECVFFLGVNQKPLIIGDNHKLQVAPYNTFYPQLEEHMNQVGIDPNVNNWDKLMILGVIDPHDSLSHPAGGSDTQSESATCLDPDHYTTFVIPSSVASEQAGSTNDNPFPLPDPYLASQQKNHNSLEEVKQLLRDTKLDNTQKRELSGALHSCFKEWLFASGNVRQLYYLPGE